MNATVKMVIILLITFTIIAWVRDSIDFGPLARVVPLCDGDDLDWPYTIGGICLLILLLWGVNRISRLDKKSKKDSEAYDEELSDYQIQQDDDMEI
jgi:hypothetical protein